MLCTLMVTLCKIIEITKWVCSVRRPSEENAISTLDMMVASDTASEITDSMVIFSDFKTVLPCSNTDKNNNYSSKKEQRKILRPRRRNKGLQAGWKMDAEDGGAVARPLKQNVSSPRPGPDCNYNTHGSSLEAMEASIDSSHELQDNSDYQWFLDYGYRENTNHQQSILSLTSSRDVCYYNDLSRDLDANLAHVDMDDFHSEILSTLPNMCCHGSSQAFKEREMFASVSGSMMVKFDFDTSMSPHMSSQEETGTSMSVCKSELLFSPVRESHVHCGNLSVDSLDLSETDMQLMVTCQANKNNYTIAFEASTHLDSDSADIGESVEMTSEESLPTRYRNEPKSQMTRSESTFTTWSKIKQLSSEHLHLRRHGSGNNNTTNTVSSDGETDTGQEQSKSLSLPNLLRHRSQLGMSVSMECSQCVKLFDSSVESNAVERAARSVHSDPAHNFNLVQLFMKQKSSSHDAMSTGQSTCSGSGGGSGSELCESCMGAKVQSSNWCQVEGEGNEPCPLDGGGGTEESLLARRRSEMKEDSQSESVEPLSTESCKQMSESVEQISDSCCSRITDKRFNVNNNNSLRVSAACITSHESAQGNGSNTESADNLTTCNCTCRGRSVEAKSMQTSRLGEKQRKVPAYVFYPNYALPSLEFLKENHYIQNIDVSRIFLRPQTYAGAAPKQKRPLSVAELEALKKTGFGHVRDWDSLAFLLPVQYKQILRDIPEVVAQMRDMDTVRDSLKPLFCLSPPPTRVKRRPSSVASSGNVDSSSSGYKSASSMSATRRSRTTRTPEEPPPRPPLPKGILRNHSLDNTKYSKTQKDNANKRYSMIELDEKNHLADPYYLKSPSRKLDDYELRMKHTKPKMAVSNLENDMRRLEELLEISAVFGDESFSDTDMLKLRTQVSKFLTMQKNLDRVTETLKNTETYNVDKHKWFEPADTPNNTPEHKRKCAAAATAGSSEGSAESSRKTVSFAAAGEEGATPPNSLNSSTFLLYQSTSEGAEEGARFLVRKRDLVLDVKRAVNLVERELSKNADDVDAVSNVCLSHLCPSLYAVLSDGLLEHRNTQFGVIRNSVWGMVEASSHQGPLTQTLSELVYRLNRDDVLTEGLVKFNAFIFGLLNAHAVDGWMSYLRTRDDMLRRFYQSGGLVVLSNTAGSAVRCLMDDLVEYLRPLAQLNLSLDLMFQAKLLHRSLVNINTLLDTRSEDTSELLTPSKHVMLVKLMQSIQNSISHSDREEPVDQLLEKLGSIHSRARNSKPRPRSGCETPLQGETVCDVSSVMKKRWSGVQLNSKLLKAFERLGEETDSEYTDSLDTPNRRQVDPRLDTSAEDTSLSVAASASKEYKRTVLSNLNKTLDKTDSSGGKSFKKLQQRWEMLSGKSGTSTPSVGSPARKTPGKLPSPVAKMSRIPRPVTSPVRPGPPLVATATTAPGAGKLELAKTRLNTTTVAAARVTRRDESAVAVRPTSLPSPGTRSRVNSARTIGVPLSRNSTVKTVRAVQHKLGADSGHLTFNEGDTLRVVLEVDDKWLLCCRGAHKGLVPKSAVIQSRLL